MLVFYQIGHETSTQCICREEKGNQLYEFIMFLQRIVKFLHRTVNLDITKTDIENRKIVGYAAVFEETYTQMYDAYGDVL